MSTLLISDLHLDPSRPAISRAFFDLLDHEARNADALYILGDLFEAWVGDDDDTPLSIEVTNKLKALVETGTPVYLIRGNRDFLIGQDFVDRTGCQLLEDPCVVELYGKPVLLMHGDLLCTDDVNYMAFRAQCRSETWQQAVLARPLDERRQLAAQLRQDSREATSNKAEDIMDVNREEVLRYFDRYQVTLLIHGHTHRPNIHRLSADNKQLTRIVLGDWDHCRWLLSYNPDHSYDIIKTAITV